MPQSQKLSVGLPVYNGENYLADAIDAILEQTFSEFTLTISDNASTDGTAAIIARYAEQDPRIRIVHHAKNLGAAPNYNSAYHEAPPSEYFIWIAHDDVPYPRLFEEAIKSLDAHPEASGVFARTAVIDGDGKVIGERDPRPELAASEAHARYADVIEQSSHMHPVFGMMRRSALERTGLHRGYTGSDRTLVAELAVIGPLVEIPEVLFALREHQDRSVRTSIAKAEVNRDAWFDTSRAGKLGFPRWRRAADFWRAAGLADSAAEKRKSRVEFLRWLVPNGHWKQLAFDVTSTLRTLIVKITGRPARKKQHREYRARL